MQYVKVKIQGKMFRMSFEVIYAKKAIAAMNQQRPLQKVILYDSNVKIDASVFNSSSEPPFL
jgi:hypothetical protein